MNARHLNILFPQWQGGGQDLSTYEGGQAIKRDYLAGLSLAEVEVSTAAVGAERRGIIGYEDILRQLAQSKALIDQAQPETIFTIGGGCDADIMPVAYLNQRLQDDLSLIWLDAHGDLNTPETSQSKLFYGMPIQVLLGNGDEEIIRLVHSRLHPSQVALLGIRDLDPAELDFIVRHEISVFDTGVIEHNVDTVVAGLKAKGHSNVYIHIDLDVLDPVEFPQVPVPSQGGLKKDTLRLLLNKLSQEFKVAGLGVFEYLPTGPQVVDLLQEIVQFGVRL